MNTGPLHTVNSQWLLRNYFYSPLQHLLKQIVKSTLIKWVSHPVTSNAPFSCSHIDPMSTHNLCFLSRQTTFKAVSHVFNETSYPTGVSQVVLVIKNLPASAGDIKDMGSISGLGRSPGGGCGNQVQYSCLRNPMDRGVRILEWVIIPFSRGSSRPREWTQVSWIASRLFTVWANFVITVHPTDRNLVVLKSARGDRYYSEKEKSVWL